MRVQVERGRVEGARCERGGVLLTPTHPRATFSLTYSLIYSLQLRVQSLFELTTASNSPHTPHTPLYPLAYPLAYPYWVYRESR